MISNSYFTYLGRYEHSTITSSSYYGTYVTEEVKMIMSKPADKHQENENYDAKIKNSLYELNRLLGSEK